MHISALKVAREKFEKMSNEERRLELAKDYPIEMLIADEYYNIYTGDVCVTVTGNGEFVSADWVTNDRY